MVEVDKRAIYLLGTFAFLMFFIPLAAYFIAVQFTTAIYSAVISVIMANMILFTFVLLVFTEEDEKPKED